MTPNSIPGISAADNGGSAFPESRHPTRLCQTISRPSQRLNVAGYDWSDKNRLGNKVFFCYFFSVVRFHQTAEDGRDLSTEVFEG